MLKAVKFHPEAHHELISAACYYEQRVEGLGKRFLEAIHTALRHIQLAPSSYVRIEQDFRRCCVDKFPFGVVFRETDDSLEIMA